MRVRPELVLLAAGAPLYLARGVAINTLSLWKLIVPSVALGSLLAVLLARERWEAVDVGERITLQVLEGRFGCGVVKGRSGARAGAYSSPFRAPTSTDAT